MSQYQNTRRLLPSDFLPFRQPSALHENHVERASVVTPQYRFTHQRIFGNGIMTVHPKNEQSMFSHPNNTPVMPIFHTTPTPTPSLYNWDSAGTIIVDDKYHAPDGSIYSAIFLGLNPRTGRYELFYGEPENNDTSSIVTAHRTCLMNSANLFRFNVDIFNDSFCVFSANKKQHVYVVRVQSSDCNIQSEIFYDNLKKLQASRAPHNWTRFSAITRISITEAISSGILTYRNGNDFSMFDVNGKVITISAHSAGFIRDMLNTNKHIYAPIYTLRFIRSYDDRFNGNRYQFLNNTKCYMI